MFFKIVVQSDFETGVLVGSGSTGAQERSKPAAAKAMKNVNKKKIVYALQPARRISQFARSIREKRSELKSI